MKGESTTVQSDGILTCLDAMEAARVDRIVVISNKRNGAAARGDDHPTRFIAKPIVRRVLRKPFKDMATMELYLQQSTTSWTILRPPRPTDKPAKGKYRTKINGCRSAF